MQHTTVGIIGLGSFGQFIAQLFAQSPHMHVIGYDPHQGDDTTVITRVDTLAEIAKAHIIVLAIPLQAYPDVLIALKPLLSSQTLLIDVCSVKTTPQQLIKQYLPEHRNLLLTHPLFGPQSAAGGAKGHTLIITRSAGPLARQVTAFCQRNLGLRISSMTAEEHDRGMAQVHALTFFVARGLRTMDLPQPAFMTPSYRELLDLIELDALHSQELYDTVQHGNPYAADMRQRFIDALKALET